MIDAESESDAEAEDGFGFDEKIEKKILALLLRDSQFATRVYGLIKPEYFAADVDMVLARIVLKYFDKYRKSPDISILSALLKDALAAKMIRADLIPELRDRIKELYGKATDVGDKDYIRDQVVAFARDRAIEQALLASVEDKEKKNYANIRKRMEQALLVGSDEGGDDYDYWEKIETRTEERKSRIAGVATRDGITTGIEELDKELYHGGWGRKELSCMLGAAKAGKSMSLGEFAKNAALAGHNVAYLSCEVAAKIVAERIDANISGVLMKKLDENAFAIQEAVKKMESKAGFFNLREYASGTLKCSEIRRYLERKRADGVRLDLLVVDYADIMAPEYRTDNFIENMRSIYIDLRAIAFEYDLAVLTATQSNREGAKKVTAGATDVAEDYNKARTVDLMLSINASEAERAAGEARLFFALARNGESDFALRIKQDRAKMRFIEKVLGRE